MAGRNERCRWEAVALLQLTPDGRSHGCHPPPHDRIVRVPPPAMRPFNTRAISDFRNPNPEQPVWRWGCQRAGGVVVAITVLWRVGMRLLFLFLGLLPVSVCAPVAQKPSPSRSAKSAATATTAAPVNLNTATQAQLESLPGIGPSAAQRILEYRQKSGSFKKIEDLMNVKGIGEKSFLKLKPLITVGTDKGERAGGTR